MLVGDGFILHGGVRLSAEQLGLLDTRSDQGWHLGWFKQKLRTVNGEKPTFGSRMLSPTPEPSSVLLGGRLLFVARRFRRGA